MKISHFRFVICATLCAVILAVSGCASFPANEPSALQTPHNGKTEAP